MLPWQSPRFTCSCLSPFLIFAWNCFIQTELINNPYESLVQPSLTCKNSSCIHSFMLTHSLIGPFVKIPLTGASRKNLPTFSFTMQWCLDKSAFSSTQSFKVEAASCLLFSLNFFGARRNWWLCQREKLSLNRLIQSIDFKIFLTWYSPVNLEFSPCSELPNWPLNLTCIKK